SHIVAARGMTMATLADELSSRLNAPVVDKTGTSDYFAVNLEFKSAQLNSAYDDRGRPTISAALEKGGLRLESAKVDVPTVIVDSIDQTPTAN
ncbi:MAG TPA: TIGR03435 family protein, partial [Bryobacteraceae bacterium]|nr:TIGR03435 family protein [Bryobacteraceae bacterium]